MNATDELAAHRADAMPAASGATSNVRFAWILTLVFLVLGIVNVLHHEMFRDELQAWMLAKHSSSLADLIHNSRLEIAPRLWFVLVYLLGKLTDQPLVMQIFHMLIAAGCVYLVAKLAPFTRIQKILFAFGYFTFYEYAVVCRYYGLGILLLLCLAALFAQRARRPVALAIVIVLLAGTNTFGWIIRAAMALTLAYAWHTDRGAGRPWPVSRARMALSAAIILIGLLGWAVFMLPANDSPHKASAGLSGVPTRIAGAVGMVTTGHLVITYYLGEHSTATAKLAQAIFHNSNSAMQSIAAIGRFTTCLEILAGAGLIVFSLLLFARRPIALFAYIVATAGLLGFFFLIIEEVRGTLRNYGHFFFIFIACLWLAHYCEERDLTWRGLNRASKACGRFAGPLLVLLLTVQVLCGIAAVVTDYRHEYSSAKATANYIRSNHLQDLPIVGNSYPVAAVSGYLGKEIHCLWRGEMGSYTLYDRVNSRNQSLPADQIMGRLDAFAAGRGRVLLVLNYPLDSEQCRSHEIRRIAEFTGSMRPDERFWLYDTCR